VLSTFTTTVVDALPIGFVAVIVAVLLPSLNVVVSTVQLKGAADNVHTGALPKLTVTVAPVSAAAGCTSAVMVIVPR
jgi:hypothetical protein